MEAVSPHGATSSIQSDSNQPEYQVDPISLSSVSSPGPHIRVDPIPQVNEYEQSECFSSSRNDVNEQRAKNFSIVETYYKADLRNLTKFLSVEVVELTDKLRDGEEPFSMHPTVSYCVSQYLLSISELLLRLEKRKVSYRNFREIAENLAGLLEAIHVRASVEESCRIASVIMANKMANLFQQWDVIAMVLEDVFLKQMTDWCQLAMVSQKKYPPSMIRQLKPPRDVVFPLYHFNKPILIGHTFYGSRYKSFITQLGQVPIMMRTLNLSKRKLRLGKVQSEIRKAAVVCVRLKHPLLARPLATAFADGFFITFAELLPSVDLGLLLDSKYFSGHGLPLEVTRLIVAQIGIAICYMHTSGFIHRDIRPENIYISAFGRIKVLCPEQPKLCVGAFTARRLSGFYRATAHEFTDHELPPNHSLYLRPPEIIRSFPYGRALDWWMLGSLTYWLYYHKVPFKRKHDKKTISAILRGAPRMHRVRISGFRDFKEFIHKAVYPKPKSRLCSKSYSEFYSHPFFNGIHWSIIEKNTMFIELFEVEELFETQASTGRFPSRSPTTSCFRLTGPTQDNQRLTPDMMKTTTINLAAGSYTSATLIRAFDKILAEEALTSLPWPEDEQEWVDQHLMSSDSPGARLPYKFNKFFKATRIPRETVQCMAAWQEINQGNG